METLTWTGSLGAILNPVLTIVVILLAISVVAQIVLSLFAPAVTLQSNPDGTLMQRGGALGIVEKSTKWLFFAALILVLIYIIGGVIMPYGSAGIIGAMSKQFAPVWITLFLTFLASIMFKRRLGLYGKLFDSVIGMIGFGLVMFWVYTAIFAGIFDLIATHDPLSQISGLKNKLPGVALPEGSEELYPHYLLGGDNLARDIFSRMVYGSTIVIAIAPMATVFAFMVGITLGLPAGFYGGRLDTVLSFLANLILAFPVILLFYLLVTPEIVQTGIPSFMAAFLFVFPIVFFGVLLNSRFYTQPAKRTPMLILVLGGLAWLYLSMISQAGTVLNFLPPAVDLFDIAPGILVVFVSVVFVNSPTVFRIVRGLALDLRTRDYVAAAQTRGEGAWYIMLWEILPNARGPLIVDFCLRIGYTTILLGTLGFFGLGLPPESPDWGSTINEGRKLLLIFVHPPLPPAIALLSLVLGLNLLADGLREESLKD
ncbi:ABC transporter permease [Yoonia sp. R2331]|uniref:ABC transporter permease n=1 Tax=Yoonia sp. R2331 TaxID=3237238 RepID=UPI0034E59847